jgi:hypothetical protein
VTHATPDAGTLFSLAARESSLLLVSPAKIHSAWLFLKERPQARLRDHGHVQEDDLCVIVATEVT